MGRFEKKAFRILACVLCVYVVGLICIKSVESELNVKSQKIESEITTLKANIESLDLQIQNKTSFSYINDYATGRGYVYNSDVTAYVSGE